MTLRGDDLPHSFVAATRDLLLGGSTTFLLNLAKGLRERGEALRVLSLTEPNEHSADFAHFGVPVSVINHRRLIYEDRLRAGYEQLAQWSPRAVLACLGSESFEMLRLVPAGVQRFGLIQSHNAEPFEMAARYARWIDAMIGVSTEIAATLRAMPVFVNTPVHAIPYGIAFPEPVTRAPRREDEPLRVIYVGRLIEEQKRVSRLVALARAIEARKVPAHLTLVGSGPDEGAVREQLGGCACVTLTSAVPNEQVTALMREQHVFVLLSDYEGLPLALLEAMGEGAVPIVSDLPSGIRQAVPDEAGFRVAVGDVEGAMRAVEMLAADAQRWLSMSLAASSHARTHFSARRMAADYLGLLRQPPGAREPWPASVDIPPPIGLNGFLFSGWRRRLRRWLKPRPVSEPRSSNPR